MARKVDEPWTKCRNPTDLDWTRAFAHDGRDPRSWPQTKPCRGQHALEQSYTANQHGAWISCARCALRLHHIPRQTARMRSVSTPSSASVQEALKRMSLFERQRLHGEGGEGHDCRSRGTEASKEEMDTTNDDHVQHRVQFWSGIQCDDQLGNPSAQRNFDTTITSVLSRQLVCGAELLWASSRRERMRVFDDGRGPVKTLSGRLALKLQRSAIAGQCGSVKTNPNGAGRGDR